MKRTALKRRTPLKPISDKKRQAAPGYALARKRVLARDRGRCIICRGSATDTHHILYRSQGGSDSDWNLASLCRSCHDQVHREGPSAWRETLLREVARRQERLLDERAG